MIRVVTVLDPFRPGTQRLTSSIEYVEGMMLDEAMKAAGVDPLKNIAVIEGKGVPPEIAAGFPVADDIEIIVMPHVGGGSFARTFAEIGVLIAAAAAVYFTAGLALPGVLGVLTGGATLGSGVASLIGAAVSIGGNLLISAFMSPSAGGGLDSATYDPTGPKTVASGGTPIPKGYGTMRWGGNIIASYVTAEGQDNYLNVLVCFGWGPASAITDIRINNTPIEDYTAATYQIRLGSNDQTPISYFNNIQNGFPQAVRCIAGTPVIVAGTGTATQGLDVVIQFPDGVFWSNTDGSLRSLSIAYKVEYAVSGSGNWQTPIIPRTTHDVVTFNPDGSIFGFPGWVVVPIDTQFSSGVVYDHDNNKSPTAHTPGDPWTATQTVTFFNADGSSHSGSISLAGEWQMCDPNLNQQIVDDWSAGYVIFTDANQATLYHTTSIYNLTPGKYDVRITKYGSAFAGDAIQPLEANNSRTGDQVWIHSINEIQYQDLAYPNMILLGVRALATNQLSGNGINVTALVTHDITTTLPSQLFSYEHDNPAVVAYDMMTADLDIYGGGVDPSQVDIPSLAQWAAYNDQLVSDGFGGTIRRHVFNGVFEEQNANLWKCLQRVGVLANCIPVQIGKNYSFIIDGPVTVPAQIFNVGNIKRDSIKDTYLSLDDRSNRVEVTFADAGRDYRTDEPCAVMTPDDIQAGVEVQTTRVQLLGCTSRAQAWHWAFRKLLDTKNTTLTRTFDVNIEGVACQIGSVIGVQDDITQFSFGGRVQAGSTSASLIVDRNDLTFTPGAGWTVSLIHPTLLRGTATISTIVGNLITTTGSLPAGRVLRVQRASGLEATVKSYGSNTLFLESVAGFSSGNVLNLYDEDAIDTQVISGYNGHTLTPASPFLQDPVADNPWVYGQSAGAFPAQLFRVISLKRKGDFDISIDCVNYNPSLYSDDTPIITETLGVPDSNAAVTSLNLTENYSMANGGNAGQLSTVSVGWQNGPATVGVELWVAQNVTNQPLSSESLLVTVTKGTTYTFPAPTGAIVEVRAVGIDAQGISSSWSNAPVKTITVQGAGTAPGDVINFGGTSSTSGTALSWVAPARAVSYEIRYNTDISNADWSTGILLWAGTATTFSEAISRKGRYMIKALASNSVESINAATYSYLESGGRLNSVGLSPSTAVTVLVTQNTFGSGGCTVVLTAPAQTFVRADGTTTVSVASSVTWAGNLAAGVNYFFYLYLSLADLRMHAALGDGVVPDTAANPTTAAMTALSGRFPIPLFNLTTATSGGGGGNIDASFAVACAQGLDSGFPFYQYQGATVTGGGSGYTSPTAKLAGVTLSGSSVVDTSLTLTVSGGAITSVNGGDSSIEWEFPPTLTVSR